MNNSKRFYDSLITPAVIAFCLLSLSAFRIIPIKDIDSHHLGIVCGLFGGYLSLLFLCWKPKNTIRMTVQKIMGFLISPVAAVYLLFLSKSFAAGYFIGTGASICLLTSYSELIKKQMKEKTNREKTT